MGRGKASILRLPMNPRKEQRVKKEMIPTTVQMPPLRFSMARRLETSWKIYVSSVMILLNSSHRLDGRFTTLQSGHDKNVGARSPSKIGGSMLFVAAWALIS